MGRKIPAKKHRGIKDPAKQHEQRFAKIKMKINEAPENLEDQEMPKKLKNLFTGFKKKKMVLNGPDGGSFNMKGKKEPNQFQPQKPLKPIPDMKRKPGESDRAYLWRTEVTTRTYLNKSKFEDKYDVDVITNTETGEVKMTKRQLGYIGEENEKVEPQTRRDRNKLKKLEKKQAERAEKKKIRQEKFRLRVMKKKGKKIEDPGHDFSKLKQDKVEFGEVAQQPPTLTAKPRKSNVLNKPGNRDLLLKGLIPSDKPSNLSGKRKDLSALDRQRLEEERQRAVELYRDMQKLKQNNKA